MAGLSRNIISSSASALCCELNATNAHGDTVMGMTVQRDKVLYVQLCIWTLFEQLRLSHGARLASQQTLNDQLGPGPVLTFWRPCKNIRMETWIQLGKKIYASMKKHVANRIHTYGNSKNIWTRTLFARFSSEACAHSRESQKNNGLKEVVKVWPYAASACTCPKAKKKLETPIEVPKEHPGCN